jgi:hypothetical protein
MRRVSEGMGEKMHSIIGNEGTDEEERIRGDEGKDEVKDIREE